MEAMERRGVLAKARAYDELLLTCDERDEMVYEDLGAPSPGTVHEALIGTTEIRRILSSARNP